jgi:hypothetical protein
MASVWTKFKNTIDNEAIKEELKSASQNKREFRDVPEGTYEVKIANLYAKESSTGKPMMVCQMKVLTGEYKNESIFYNQVIIPGFVKTAVRFLESLESDVEIVYEDIEQFEDLIFDVLEAVKGNYEYVLQYGKDKKGFGIFEIKEVFDVE